MAASSLRCFPSSSSFSLSKGEPHQAVSCYKPIKVVMAGKQTSWATINSEVEAHIEHALSGRQPASVYNPMNHLIFEVPRSMAPALCMAACEAVGGQKEQAIAAASAIHLMHVATYTHEYLPLSDLAKPKPLANHTYEPNVELLTADSMMPLGYELLAEMDDAKENSNSNSERILRVMIEIGRTMGPRGVVDGQYLKSQSIGWEGDEACQKEGIIEQMLQKKGGGLYSCGAACGAILGGGSDQEIEKMRRFGLYVGMIHGVMVHVAADRDHKFLKFADGFRCLALEELEGLKSEHIEHFSSIMDGFAAFLSVQKHQFPQSV